MNVTTLVLRRLAIGVVTVMVVSLLVFVGTEILPGDVAQAILGQGATPELVANVRIRLGLDDPAYLRYLRWLGRLLTGDLGTALSNGAVIADGRALGHAQIHDVGTQFRVDHPA